MKERETERYNVNEEGEMRRTSAVASSLNLYFHRPYSRICSSGTGDLTVAEAFRATLPLSFYTVLSRSTAL